MIKFGDKMRAPKRWEILRKVHVKRYLGIPQHDVGGDGTVTYLPEYLTTSQVKRTSIGLYKQDLCNDYGLFVVMSRDIVISIRENRRKPRRWDGQSRTRSQEHGINEEKNAISSTRII